MGRNVTTFYVAALGTGHAIFFFGPPRDGDAAGKRTADQEDAD